MKIYLLLFLSIIVCSGRSFGQYRDQGTGGGVGVGIQFGGFGAEENRVRSQERIFLRHTMSDRFQGEIGIGKSEFAGQSYRTQLTNADYRFLWSLFTFDASNLFLYGGIGGIYYEVKDLPASSYLTSDQKGWTGYVPGGIGLQIAVNRFTSIELSGGVNYFFRDDLKGAPTDRNTMTIGFLAGITIHGEGGEADNDGDRLTNTTERKLGTDPDNSDTDGDGVSDGDEFYITKTNPLSVDSDGDGLSDGDEEKLYHSNANAKDSDGDGLADNDELKTYHTDLNKWDTDGDGLKDRDEIEKYKTDPLKPDTDGDGLSDGAEVLTSHTDPLLTDSDGDKLSDAEEVKKYSTNPLSQDTDNDGLTDFEEINHYLTDPTLADTDGDGLRDSDELVKSHTDPLERDTDGGTVNDSVEVARGSNPRNANDDIVEHVEEAKLDTTIGKTIVLDGVVFESGKAALTPASTEILTKAFNTLNENPEIEVEIHGYTDSTGRWETNVELSQLRADAVRAYLIQQGISAERIIAKGFGPNDPIAPNDTPEGRAQNRRVDIVMLSEAERQEEAH